MWDYEGSGEWKFPWKFFVLMMLGFVALIVLGEIYGR